MRSLSVRMVLALLVVGNLVLGGALFALRTPWAVAPAVNPPPPLPPQVQDIQRKIADNSHGEPYTLSLTDAEFTATANHFLAITPDVPFSVLGISVTGQKVVVDAVTRDLAVKVPVRATGTVTTKDGLPRATVENVSLGDTSLPSFVRDQILRQVNASLDFSQYSIPVTVDAVDLHLGAVTIRGTVK